MVKKENEIGGTSNGIFVPFVVSIMLCIICCSAFLDDFNSFMKYAGFPLSFMPLTAYCLAKQKPAHVPSWKTVLSIIVGDIILMLPLVISSHSMAILPMVVLSLIGILFGWLCDSKKHIIIWFASVMVISLCAAWLSAHWGNWTQVLQ